MMHPRLGMVALFSVSLACGQQVDAGAEAGKLTLAPATKSAEPFPNRRKDSAVHVPTPDTLRGLYVNRWAALGSKLTRLIGVAKKTEVNALVIDVKDDRGFVLYRSNVALAREIGADTADGHWMSSSKLRAVLDTMIANGIYPIARIVVAKDPLLARKRLDLAIKRKSDLKPWLDKNGHPWLDPHQRAVWQYAADLAREAYEIGFSEVQFDYVRFPDEKRLIAETVYPLANGRTRAQVIREQLGFVRSALKQQGIRVTADVFGLTATDTTDMGIGQQWEMFVDQVDVVLPMIYPSHFARGTYKLRNPNAHPYKTIDNALKDAIARSASISNAAKIIPWYQDFTLGRPRYSVAEIRAQKKAGYDNGFQSWILWNPKSNYTLAALEPQS
ncbi:MAG TPA: putative glycoside hydrolase [Gemmatimonadaceae bacterium]|nr:putative glycoside hydrolase [Gemmatimonadaceae bacterium]